MTTAPEMSNIVKRNCYSAARQTEGDRLLQSSHPSSTDEEEVNTATVARRYLCISLTLIFIGFYIRHTSDSGSKRDAIRDDFKEGSTRLKCS